MRDPCRGHAALRLGRASVPGREYFLTICAQRERWDGRQVIDVAKAMDADATWRLRCVAVMPDHIHLLAILGERLSLGKAVSRLKAKTSAEWERGFFDRAIRPEEDRLSLFLYIYLNPHRAGLCARTEAWPWFYCRDEDWAWFKNELDSDRPPPEWLM